MPHSRRLTLEFSFPEASGLSMAYSPAVPPVVSGFGLNLFLNISFACQLKQVLNTTLNKQALADAGIRAHTHTVDVSYKSVLRSS